MHVHVHNVLDKLLEVDFRLQTEYIGCLVISCHGKYTLTVGSELHLYFEL